MSRIFFQENFLFLTPSYLILCPCARETFFAPHCLLLSAQPLHHKILVLKWGCPLPGWSVLSKAKASLPCCTCPTMSQCLRADCLLLSCRWGPLSSSSPCRSCLGYTLVMGFYQCIYFHPGPLNVTLQLSQQSPAACLDCGECSQVIHISLNIEIYLHQ